VGYSSSFSGGVSYVSQRGVVMHSKHPLYSTWRMMNVRCYDNRHCSYHRYGGRGIAVEQVWCWDNPFGFANFVLWACNEKQHGLTLDRVDNNKNYAPDNCRWATKKEQSNNTTAGIANTTGFLGVSPCRSDFISQITLNGKTHVIGIFETKDEAHRKYECAKKIKMSNGDDHVANLIAAGYFKKKGITGRALSIRKTSKHFGVCWSEKRDKWRAFYSHKVNGKHKQKHIGYFEDEDEAGLAVEKYVKEVVRGQK
jgi:hypothetical protein